MSNRLYEEVTNEESRFKDGSDPSTLDIVDIHKLSGSLMAVSIEPVSPQSKAIQAPSVFRIWLRRSSTAAVTLAWLTVQT